MKFVYDEFINHVNTADQYQQGDDTLAVCGPLNQSVELPALREIVLNKMPAGDVIEIGSWLGLSTITIAMALRERFGYRCKYEVVSIDPHDKEHSINSDSTGNWFNSCPFDIHEKFLENIKKWKVDDLVNSFRMFSNDYQYADKCSMLFIDGDHRPKQVNDDLEHFVPLVVKGGYVVMHDRSLVTNVFDEFNKSGILEIVPGSEVDHRNVLIIARKK